MYALGYMMILYVTILTQREFFPFFALYLISVSRFGLSIVCVIFPDLHSRIFFYSHHKFIILALNWICTEDDNY